MSKLKHAYRISRFLGAFPSLYYAALYLLCIPIFAGAYYLCPGQFYYSAPTADSRTYMDFDALSREVRSAIIDDFRRINREEVFTIGESTYLVDTLNTNAVHGSITSHDRIEFSCSIMVAPSNAPRSEAKPMLFTLLMQLWPFFSTPHEDLTSFIGVNPKLKFRIHAYFSVEAFTQLNLPPDFIRRLLIADEELHTQNFKIPVIPISDVAYGYIEAYYDETSGNKRLEPQDLDRLLYFSVATITTVGYGDIVPLSRRTRLLVSLEAISGILLIGLFLNALSYERQFDADSPDGLDAGDGSDTPSEPPKQEFDY